VRRLAFLAVCLAVSVAAAEKPCITFKAPPAAEGDRPVAVAIIVGAQGSDYGFQVDFNRPPWGDECGTRCANATIFLDTDNNKATGLKLKDPKAVETGADLAVTIQGMRTYTEGAAHPGLKVKVTQYTEESTSVDTGKALEELDAQQDGERVNATGTTVYLLVDANTGDLPSGQKVRVIYHPPDARPLVGMAKGLSAPGANRVEIFKDGRLTNPKKKKSQWDY